MIYFGMKLHQLREEKGLTQKMLGEAVGLSPAMISLYERGGSYPSVAALISLSQFFKVSMDYLVGLTDTNSYDLSGLTDEQAVTVTDMIRQLEQANARERG